MSQEQIEIQRESQELRQRVSASQQQMLEARLTQLPINQLIERIEAEAYDNPALELGVEEFEGEGDLESRESDGEGESGDDGSEDDRWDDDELPVYGPVYGDRKDRALGVGRSFYDSLREQMSYLELSDEERRIMEYVVCSLDDDGLLRKTSDMLSDELAIYQDIEAGAGEVEKVVEKVQEFEPAGIGARNLQECLILQIKRKPRTDLTDRMLRVVVDYFDYFTHKRWDKIREETGLGEEDAERVMVELRKLNPKPGLPMDEEVGGEWRGSSSPVGSHYINPDVFIETHDDGQVSYSLNDGGIPGIRISRSFSEIMDVKGKGVKDGEALRYVSHKVESAKGFIDAVRKSRRNLSVTVRAIIEWQHDFFVDGDEASLRPMRLKDIGEKTGLDISILSRVTSHKYAQTSWGMFPLKYFFNESFVARDGSTLAFVRIKAAIEDILDGEDKERPLSDEAICLELRKRGFEISRRTVTKYRKRLGIGSSGMRKESGL